MGVTRVTNFFQNFEVDTKIPKSPKLALITKILKKILKTPSHIWSCPPSRDSPATWTSGHAAEQPICCRNTRSSPCFGDVFAIHREL